MRLPLSKSVAGAIFLLVVLICRVPAFCGVPIIDGEVNLNVKYAPLTKDALLSALRDQDGDVRVLAAALLANQKFPEAVPFILTV